MKTIGLIGGMSWESTTSYYQLINRQINAILGGLHSAKIVLVSVDFAEIEQLQQRGHWQEAGQLLSKAAQSLQAAGADFFLICTNTMHIVAEQVCQAVNIPLVHIADATGQALQTQKITRIGLLGTQFTMQQGFYKDRIQQQFNIEVLVPNLEQQSKIHEVIYHELCLGKISSASRDIYLKIMAELQNNGAQGIILGCTEIGLLVSQQQAPMPLFDTTFIHAKKAVQLALA